MWCSILAAIGLIIAPIWELTRKDPMVDFRMLKERNFAIATFNMFMLGFVIYGSTVLLPILMQTLMGYTAMLNGLVLSPGGVVTLIALPVVARLMRKFEARWLVGVGLLITGYGLIHMSHFNLYISFWTITEAWMV